MTEFYHGTVTALAIGATVQRDSSACTPVDTALDAGRPAGAVRRSGSVSAAMSPEDATAIAAIRAYSRTAPVPHCDLRLYRVQLVPWHEAPLAVLEELECRLATGTDPKPLIREYWQPTGEWRLKEVLTPSFTVVEAVTPASEAGIRVRRWMDYGKDRDRAHAFEPTIQQHLRRLLYP